MSSEKNSTSLEHEVEFSYENNSSNNMIKADNPAAQSYASNSGTINDDANAGFISNAQKMPFDNSRNPALGNKGFHNRADLGSNADSEKDPAFNKNNSNVPNANGNNPMNNNAGGSKGTSGNGLDSGLDKKSDDFSGDNKKGENGTNNKNNGNTTNGNTVKGNSNIVQPPHKNPLPGAAPPIKRPSKNDPSSAHPKESAEKKKSDSSIGKKLFDNTPVGKKLNGAKQALGMNGGEKKDGNGDGNGEGSGFNPVALLSGAGSFILTFKVQLIVAGIFLLIIFAFILSVGTGVPVGVAIGANGCDQPSYTANSANATEFMCNMLSPFGPEAAGKEYSVSSTSGKRVPPATTSGYGSNFHQGTDVTGVKGGPSSDLYAVADGEVVSAEYAGGWGNQVLIKHLTTSTIFYTRYAHMSSIAVSKGAHVNGGDKIGVMGSTGNSSGPHLHFELLDENKNYISANPFFGYSDLGYEGCLTPNGDIPDSKCDFDASGSARYIGQEGFAQICGKTTGSFVDVNSKNNACCGTLTAETTGGDIFEFISTFEGGTGSSYTCKTSDGKDGYKAYQHAGDKVTVGPGITTDFIKGMKPGDCISKATVKDGYTRAEKSKRDAVKKDFSGISLSKHQEDAMVSMRYNGCATFFTDMAKAAKNDSLADLWKAMKDCTNGGLLGLQRRRKAEFALYVTGDYSLAGAYKAKNWSAVEYDFYDSDGILAKRASGSSSTICGDNISVGGYSTTDVVKLAQKELETWQTLSLEQKRKKVTDSYLPACGYGNKNILDHYCAGFISYLLKETGNLEKVGAGVNNKCLANTWKNSTGGTFHKVGSSYTPKPGDLAIYSGHIEIVEKVSGNMVTTISGNSSPFNLGTAPNGDTVGNVVRKTPFPLDTKVEGYLSY